MLMLNPINKRFMQSVKLKPGKKGRIFEELSSYFLGFTKQILFFIFYIDLC